MKPFHASSAFTDVLYWAVIVGWIVSEISIFTRAVNRSVDSRQDRLSGPALIGSALIALWLGSAAAGRVTGAAITQARPEVFGLGLIIAVAGIAFRQLAFSSLGRFFTTRVTTRADQTVVETGPYRFIRHPSYSGFLMTVLGVLLCETNWLSLACFLLAMPGLAYRIKVEERALLDGLGAPYQDYMRRTKRLVPFVV